MLRPDYFAYAEKCDRQQHSGDRHHCDKVDTKVTVAAGVAAKGGKEQRAKEAVASPSARVKRALLPQLGQVMEEIMGQSVWRAD